MVVVLDEVTFVSCSVNLGRLLSLVRENGCEYAHCKFIDQGRYPGVLLVARTPQGSKRAGSIG
jgi:hypothetical protein